MIASINCLFLLLIGILQVFFGYERHYFVHLTLVRD